MNGMFGLSQLLKLLRIWENIYANIVWRTTRVTEIVIQQFFN